MFSTYGKRLHDWIDVENLTRAAEMIIIGSVRQVGPSWMTLGGTIFTGATVAVSDFIKNPSSDTTLHIRTLGGTTACYGMWVEDQPSFVENEKVLLFLRHSTFESREPYLVVVGGPQGEYTIVDNTAYWGGSGNSRPLDDLIAEIRKYL